MCVMMGVVVAMIGENLDVITGVCSINYGESYAHLSAVFCLYFNAKQRVSIWGLF